MTTGGRTAAEGCSRRRRRRRRRRARCGPDALAVDRRIRCPAQSLVLDDAGAAAVVVFVSTQRGGGRGEGGWRMPTTEILRGGLW